MAYAKDKITTKEEFKDWVLRKLGFPLVSVELTDDMLSDAIDDAIAEYTEYVYQDRIFYYFKLDQYVANVGAVLPENIVAITNVNSNVIGPNAAGSGKIDNYMNDLLANGAVNFPLFGRSGSGGWLSYELAMSYLKQSQRMLGGDYDYEFNPRTHLLTLYPDPILTENDKLGWIICTCAMVNPDEYQYRETWVKRMALAQAQITLGEVRSKFTGINLPGGGTLNLRHKDDGAKERDELRTELHQRYPCIDIFHI